MIETQTHTLWSEVLKDLEVVLSKANFNTWFKNTHIAREEEGTIFIGVPNEFVKEWLTTKYHKPILKALRDRSEAIRSVEYVVARRETTQKQEVQPIKFTPNRELPLSDLYINREDNLNPKYTFDTFIIGPFNELAYSAAQAIIHRPTAYNPLFIYGGTGLGKTHLIQAVGNTLKTKHPGMKVFYTTSERFSTDYVNAVQGQKINIFKEKYRKYDLLIMDDVQFLTGKEKTQEELFHAFNTLHDNNKQIMFSSDKHPHFIPGLEERLKSRFSAGMIVDISQPDFETRLAILKSKSEHLGISIDPPLLEHVALTVQGNIRELEGALNTVVCQMRLKNRQLSLGEMKPLIKSTARPKKNVSVKDVVKIIADFYGIEEGSLYEKTRRKEIVRSRQIAMYVLREDFNVSYPLIGRKLGGKDHTTVIHSCLKIKKDLGLDTGLIQEIEQIRALLNMP